MAINKITLGKKSVTGKSVVVLGDLKPSSGERLAVGTVADLVSGFPLHEAYTIGDWVGRRYTALKQKGVHFRDLASMEAVLHGCRAAVAAKCFQNPCMEADLFSPLGLFRLIDSSRVRWWVSGRSASQGMPAIMTQPIFFPCYIHTLA